MDLLFGWWQCGTVALTVGEKVANLGYNFKYLNVRRSQRIPSCKQEGKAKYKSES